MAVDHENDTNEELFALTGKVALVTGSSRGLGWAVAQGLARAGATVLLNGRDAAVIDERVDELRARGHAAVAAVFDVGDDAASARAIDEVVSSHGRLDVLVSNVGHRARIPVASLTVGEFRGVLDVNLTATFRLARDAAEVMRQQGGGRIVLVSSIAARLGSPITAAYSASKAGMEALARVLAVTYGRYGVLTNAIAPGMFATEYNQAATQDPRVQEVVDSRLPLRRWGRPDELAGAVVFLASAAGSYVNGHVLVVDGGLTISNV
jgi:gluconate 5-dehydrogenase